MPRSTKATNGKEYFDHGIAISPAVISAGEKVKLMYDGLLSKSGATSVYAHIGFGSDWRSSYDYQMNRTDMGFEAEIPVAQADTLHVCFKDSASNWDNNSGRNYTFDVL